MIADLSLRTTRLELVPATLQHVRAEYSGREGLAAVLGADVPSSWPPGEYDRDALDFFKGKLESAGAHELGWYNWYVMSASASGSRRSLVAAAGFLGPPSSEGAVEIGYSVVPEARGLGYAIEIVEALVAHALASPVVRVVIAHTHDDNVASSSVLRRCGFHPVGPGAEQGTSRYERERVSELPGPVREQRSDSTMNPASTTIRPFQDQDESAIVGVWLRSGQAAYPFLPSWQALTLERAGEIFRKMIRPHCNIWVGTRNGDVVAFLAMAGSCIDRMYVDPAEWRKGWGTRLLLLAKTLYPDGLELHTHQENHAARRLYEKHGFKAVKFSVSPPPESAPDVEYHWRPDDIEGT